MENISGYTRVIARVRVKQQVTKPFLGKPHLRYGECWWLWSYFFQLGGILGAKHSAKLDAFGPAFIGMQGPSGAIKQFFTSVAKHLVPDSVNDSMKFQDYVGTELIRRLGYTGDAPSFFVEHGSDKLPPDTAEELAWQYSRDGAALGAIHPHIVKKMFDRTHAAVPKDEWDQARSAGLNIPPEQDLMGYEETEKEENGSFMAYCRQFCPSLYSVLSK